MEESFIFVIMRMPLITEDVRNHEGVPHSLGVVMRVSLIMRMSLICVGLGLGVNMFYNLRWWANRHHQQRWGQDQHAEEPDAAAGPPDPAPPEQSASQLAELANSMLQQAARRGHSRRHAQHTEPTEH